MTRFFHDQACRRNRVPDPFDRGNGSGFEVGPFHDCGIHTLHPVQLAIRASSCVEQSRLFQKTDGGLNSGDGKTSLRKNAVAGRDRIGQTAGLRRCHTPGTGASVSKNERR